MHISWVATHEIYIFRFTRWNKWQIHFVKNEFSFFLYIILSVTDFFALYDVIHFCTLRHINDDCITCNVGQNWNHMSRSRESENFSKSRQIDYQNFPCNQTKKMNTHTLCFCPLIRKLQAFEILKWAQGSQWRNQRTSNFTPNFTVEKQLIHHCKIQLFIFSRLRNTAFLKYALYLLNIFLYFITLYMINKNIQHDMG